MEGRDGRRARRRTEDGHQARHPERDTDLARHGVEGGTRGEALWRQRGGGGAAERGQHQPDADAADDAAGQVGAHVVGGGAGVGDPPESPGREEQRAGGADGAVPQAGPEQPTGEGGQRGEQGPGGDHEAGPQDRLVPDPGEEQHATEDQRPEAAEEGERAHVGEGDGAVANHGGLNDGVGVAERAHHQPGARGDRHHEGADDACAEPAPVGALDDGGDQAGHADREQRRAQQVGLVGFRIAHLAQQAKAEDEGEHAEGQVHQEDPAPAHLDQEPADGRTEGGRGPADGGPQPDGGALALGAEGRAGAGRARSAA